MDISGCSERRYLMGETPSKIPESPCDRCNCSEETKWNLVSCGWNYDTEGFYWKEDSVVASVGYDDPAEVARKIQRMKDSGRLRDFSGAPNPWEYKKS